MWVSPTKVLQFAQHHRQASKAPHTQPHPRLSESDTCGLGSSSLYFTGSERINLTLNGDAGVSNLAKTKFQTTPFAFMIKRKSALLKKCSSV